jgi:predicted RNA-binding protein with RPS1 domain
MVLSYGMFPGLASLTACCSWSSQLLQDGRFINGLRPGSGGWSNLKFGFSGQLQEDVEVGRRSFYIKVRPSAEYVSGKGEDFRLGRRDQGGYRFPKPSKPTTNGKINRFDRGFPDSKYGDPVITVPAEALRPGARFKGTVSSIQSFGAFVTFGAFADGLLHISKLSADYVKSVDDVLEVGQEVMVRIVSVELLTGRISLSLEEKGEVDMRKPYVVPRRKGSRQSNDRPSFNAGSPKRSYSQRGEYEDRVSSGSCVSSSGSRRPFGGRQRSGSQPVSSDTSQSMIEDVSDRESRNQRYAR